MKTTKEYKMGLKAGMTNNPGGRPKGKPNKVTADLRQWITSFIDGNTAQIESDWQQLEPGQRIVLFEKLLKYALPTLQAVRVTDDIDSLSDEQVEILYNKLKAV